LSSTQALSRAVIPAASSEKLAHQFHLFDEVELEAEIDALRDQLPDDVEEDDAPRADPQ
jgi:transposase